MWDYFRKELEYCLTGIYSKTYGQKGKTDLKNIRYDVESPTYSLIGFLIYTVEIHLKMYDKRMSPKTSYA